MKNIELKVGIDNFRNIVDKLRRLRAKHIGKLLQTDTYYNCSKGRLKIRETNNLNIELVFYQRPDKRGSKISYYLIFKIERPRLKNIKSILSAALGEKVVVKKERDLWLYKNTRIHLDKVSRLGNFLELETVVEKAGKNANKEQRKVINLLNLLRYKTYNKSYSDMALNK